MCCCRRKIVKAPSRRWRYACELDSDNALYGYKLGDARSGPISSLRRSRSLSSPTRNDPKRSDTFNELGKVQWFWERYDDAAKSFRQAVKLEPKSAVYNYHLGVMLETTDWPADAIEYYRRAVEADGDKPGLAILALGDVRWSGPISSLRRPRSLKPATRNDPKRSALSTSWARSSGLWESTMTPLNRSGKRSSWNPKRADLQLPTWESCWRLRLSRQCDRILSQGRGGRWGQAWPRDPGLGRRAGQGQEAP